MTNEWLAEAEEERWQEAVAAINALTLQQIREMAESMLKFCKETEKAIAGA